MPTRGPDLAMQKASEAYNNRLTKKSYDSIQAQESYRRIGDRVIAGNVTDDDYDYVKQSRIPWYMYSMKSKKEAMQKGIDIFEYEECIGFNCNPSQYTLDIPFRQSVAKAKGGLVVHTFRDIHRGNTNLDFGTIQITFESGSILPRKFPKKSSNSNKTGFPKGLGNYYRFLDIIQQDRVFRNESNEIEPNYIVLVINTLAFPHLVLYTYPLDKVGNGENVENISELSEWTGNFQIIKTEPTLFNGNGGLYDSLRSNWENEGRQQ